MLEFSEILEHFKHRYDHLPVPILVVNMHRIVRKATHSVAWLNRIQMKQQAALPMDALKCMPVFQQEQFLLLLPEDSHNKYGNPFNKKENNHVDQ